ncbi:MAG: ceramidase domain-containing protein [Acidimicrobiia bacterium]|nr:ceramidase domain-containing protein [Acidimicrobiia bacterium]
MAPHTFPGVIVALSVVTGEIGESDCEALGDGALAQPVNSWTSIAYIGMGLAIAVSAVIRRGRVADVRAYLGESLVYAACLAAVGLGSVLFHGPQPDGSRTLHDLPILITIVFIVVHDVYLVFPNLRQRWVAFVGAAIAAIVLTLLSADAGIAATGIGIAATVALEYVIFRKRLRPIPARRQVQAYAAIVGVAAVAGASWLLGRSDSPLCDPQDVFQFHGVWHTISSLIFGLWWWLAIDRSSTAPADRDRVVTPPDSD